MSSPVSIQSIEVQSVGIAKIETAKAPTCLTAVLGSGVGIAIYEPGSGFGMLAHSILPDSGGRPAKPGKFVDTAVPWMVRQLTAQGAQRDRLVAKVAGAASMFRRLGPLRIGDANGQAVMEALRRAGVRVDGTSLGGSKGRRVCFDPASGQLIIEMTGADDKVL